MTRQTKTACSILLRLVLGVLLVSAVARLLSKRLTEADEASDEFQIATIIGGHEFDCRAAALRSGSVLTVVGGAQVDLRQAGLDPAGATLDITAIVGGVQVLVSPGWDVQVDSRGKLGGVDTVVTEAADLPADAPRLQVTTNAWFGGVQITSAES